MQHYRQSPRREPRRDPRRRTISRGGPFNTWAEFYRSLGIYREFEPERLAGAVGARQRRVNRAIRQRRRRRVTSAGQSATPSSTDMLVVGVGAWTEMSLPTM